VSWPGWDPWHVANPVENCGRREFYDIFYVPSFRTDGWIASNKTSLPIHWEYEYHDNGETPVLLSLSGSYDEATQTGNFQIRADVECELPEGEYRLFAVVTEDVTHYGRPFYDTMHKAYPDHEGWSVDEFPTLVSAEFDLCGDSSGAWDMDECRVICWLQDVSGDKVVYQAASSSIQDLRLGTSVPAAEPPFRLSPPFPNPFNPSTRIPLSLDAPSALSLEILTAEGRRVATLHEGALDAGRHEFTWGGRDEDGNPVASGLYFARCGDGKSSQTQKLLMLK